MHITVVNVRAALAVKSRLFINPLLEQLGFSGVPVFQCLNRRYVVERTLWHQHR